MALIPPALVSTWFLWNLVFSASNDSIYTRILDSKDKKMDDNNQSFGRRESNPVLQAIGFSRFF
jgi:hypothetical protein